MTGRFPFSPSRLKSKDAATWRKLTEMPGLSPNAAATHSTWFNCSLAPAFRVARSAWMRFQLGFGALHRMHKVACRPSCTNEVRAWSGLPKGS
jgi:hypothetical protein